MSRGFRTGPGFARPENALKRADELENVGQKQSALQALHDIITSKKHRTWSKTYESIMFKHIDLCVEMKKRNYAKEALMQYRNLCQQVNINSLEEVIKYFLKTANDKAEEAQAKAAAVTIDVEDLEDDATPEDIMLSYVSGEKSKDRTDRELVTPWFRFLWETYRSVLEILRTNPKLEPLYAMTANKAFQFCLQYKRTAEFRRLCDILRQHFANQNNRFREQREAQPESIQLHLETRFEQLKVACELELWAEAFRSVEDIQALITLAKKSPKQQMMATYFARLTQIFAVSENHLYHAYAWLKLFNFSKTYNKNLTQSDLQLMACSVLLATLSILPYDRTDGKADDAQAEQEKERTLRMANILGFSVDAKKDYKNVLSRSALLASIQNMNLLGIVPVEVRQIYELLTSDFNPLELCSKLNPLLERLEALSSPMSPASPVKDVNLPQYIAALRQVAILRMLKQLSDVYSTMKISSLATVVPFAPFGEVESIVMDAVKFEFLQVHINHRLSTLHFGGQQLESDKIRNHLTLLSKRLTKSLALIHPEPSEAVLANRKASIAQALEIMEKDHQRAIARKVMIERRKEEQELQLLEQEKEEERKRMLQAREAEVAEEKRRREEMLRREKERLEKELEERELEEARAILDQSKKKTGKGVKDGEKLDKKQLMQEVLTERLKEQQELERKLAKMVKQMDHLERAKREEEIPFIEQLYSSRANDDVAYHQEQQKQFVEAHRKAWEADIVEKRRLSGMLPDKVLFQDQVVSRRQEEFAQLQAERERLLAERRAQAKLDREIARRKEYVRRCREQVQLRVSQEMTAAREAEEERVRKELEEEERLAAEEEERKASEAKAAAAAKAGYVPPHLRGAGGADSSSSSAAAPSAGSAEQWSRPAAAAADRDRVSSERSDDRWARRDEPPPRRDDRWGSSRDAPPRDAPPRDSRDSAPPSSGSKFVPPALRRTTDERPPPTSSTSSDSRPPPSSGGGGAYRPPNRR